ncbi:MAG: fused MFS/spermidine synthase [Anaerolineae bacterium]|nr:fused MFS/spermidine synthase [Anaerolineae bacterium]
MQTPSTRLQTRFLYLAVFTGGMTTLAVELSASRLLGSIFGTSNVVWANIIGLILVYLTAGYFIGGHVADRWPNYVAFYRVITWAAFFSGLVPLIAHPILQAAATAVQDYEAAVTVGSFVSVLIIFAVPVTLLGFVSPYSIRLALATIEDAGRTTGQLYALSTLGSIIGNFTPVLLLIPQVGTARTFLIFAGILMAVGLIGLWLNNRRAALQLLWMPILLIVLAILALRGPLRPPPSNMTLLYEKESAYNLVQVVENQNGYRYLLLNEGQGIHSQWHPTDYYYRRTWGFFLTAPYFNNPPFTPDQVERIAVIGLAAGTITRQYDAVYPGLPMDGIEIDPDIVEAGRQYMGMTQPNLNVIIEDGRFALNQLDTQYTMIGIDAYRVPYVPWHLTTVEFFQEINDHLTNQGVVAINVGRTQTDRRLVEALTRSMLDVFPSVHTLDVPDAYNTILVATKQPTQSDNLHLNMDLLPDDVHPILIEALTDATTAIMPTVAANIRLTDDHAPVEMIVDSMVIDFLLHGGVNELK